MPVEVLVGVPGSGKTTEVIRTVNACRREGREVYLFMCSDAHETRSQSAIAERGLLVSRGYEQTRIDHFVDAETARSTISELAKRGPTHLVFEEAQYFGEDFAELWGRLSAEGHSVLVSTPTAQQTLALQRLGARVRRLTVLCNICGAAEATIFYLLPETKATLSVCAACGDAVAGRMKVHVLEELINNEPYPGEKRIYQPVDLDIPGIAELVPIREDSLARAGIMRSFVEKYLGSVGKGTKNYLDVGCNTGYFCRYMASIGFFSVGVDVVEKDIKLARVLDSYFYKKYGLFLQEDAVKFLERDDQKFDVVSSFSVFQWLYLQTDRVRVSAALNNLFRKASRLLFFEIGYTQEAHYKGVLQEKIDRDWVFEKMHGSGAFSEIFLHEEGSGGLKRDFFVGLRGT